MAPTPTGRLHLGHALTFRVAYDRCRAAAGTLVMRNEDLDPGRCRRAYFDAAVADLKWLGLHWDEGPAVGGAYAPYAQSERAGLYRAAWEALRGSGFIYPCRCSRKDLQRAAQAPHADGAESLYPGICREDAPGGMDLRDWPDEPGIGGVCWRFRVPEDRVIVFGDGGFGSRSFLAGSDFGDFVVWRRDGVAAYELAVVVDDAAMRITEVVRGADLLLSTARQILVYEALGLAPPLFFHTPLVADRNGQRLAKRDRAASIGSLREEGYSAVRVLAMARERTMIER